MPAPFTVAIVADVHGNAAALEAVLADLATRPVDATVVAGDLVLFGPRPAAALARVRALEAVVIFGNTDRLLVGDVPESGLDAVLDWCRARIGEEGVRYLAALPFEHRITPPGGRSPDDDLLVVHATPTDVHAVLLLEPGPFGTDVTPAPEAAALVGAARAKLIVYGHIHYASAGIVAGRRLASVGAVGFPLDGDPRAAYALVEWDGDDWSVTHHRVAYDHLAVADEVRRSALAVADRLARRLTEARPVPLD